MTDYFMPLSPCLSQIKQRHTPIAYHAGHYYTGEQFYAAVALWTQRFQAQAEQNYALYTEAAYPFAVLLFALFHAKKTVWLASNNRPETARQLQQHGQLIGDWSNEFSYDLDTDITIDAVLSPLNADDTQLIIFTSGSTGEAKPIIKRLAQLEAEIATLEQQWGQQVGKIVLSTVSHQHIYGLLFQVLWPLAAGRCFHSQRYLNPETLLHSAQNSTACWVASPAQLKRLTTDTPWSGIAELSMIFSSGGELPEFAAQQLLANAQQTVIEIYGSSETGGIAWRQQSQAWRLFTGMKLTQQGDKWQLHSSYLLDSVLLDDQLELQTDGCFILRGRLDRIVKIEEKRLSLTELEQCLRATPWVAEAFTLSLTAKRDLIAAALVLTETGQQLGRNALLQALRTQLHQRFEAVLLPRKWLFINSVPLTHTGKIDQCLLMQLFNADTSKLPYTHSIHREGNQLELLLKVPASLRYFPNHFANHPILPGVVQIAWVEHFARLFFGLTESFPTLEVIKFVRLIQPNDELKLTLHWQADSKKLQFTFRKAEQICSSGRLIADIRV
jgi:acyl-coenzyme A synthetase/AMP-(fatty) acid ligase/3-hydroxymyristoyl/3-hydroxydecanoyl-(acyl carrier protein) dehydratase